MKEFWNTVNEFWSIIAFSGAVVFSLIKLYFDHKALEREVTEIKKSIEEDKKIRESHSIILVEVANDVKWIKKSLENLERD